MTKRWGLDLDMSAVRLMRQDGEGWVEEAVEKIDSPDIEERLGKMLSVIETGAPVQLFLPRDQILYTDVELAKGAPEPQIERALDGLTPYALDELSFDWEETSPGTARVAAIALDTLDEAAAFAEVRQIAIGGYSSLAEADDFPRQPVFAGPSITPEIEDETQPDEAPEAEAPSFATARKPSRPPGSEVAAATAAVRSRITPVASREEPPVASAKAPEPARADPAPEPLQLEAPKPKPDSAPVVEVDDPTPVMKVKPPSMPLDPGIPISAPNAPPRVRTDIAAASISGTAASLTPPASIRLRNRATPQLGVAAVFAVAFLITVGVAVLVWNLLPMRPGTTTIMPPAAESIDGSLDTGESDVAAIVPEAAPDTDVAAAPEPETASDEDVAIAPETEEPAAEAPAEVAGPAPILQASAPTLAAPETGLSPEIARLGATFEPPANPAPLFRALRDGTRLPRYDPTVPDSVAPPELAGIMTAPPFPGPEPDVEREIDDIYFASVERASIGFDAIALPDPRSLAADPVPTLDAEPAEPAQIDAGAVEAALSDALAGPGGLIQTELAASLPDTEPRPRPGNVLAEIERRQFGGFTRGELADRRPPPRPASAQAIASAEAPAPASELAVGQSLVPRGRPDDFTETVAEARALIAADRVTASTGFSAPDTSAAVNAALEADAEPEARPEAPRQLDIPTSASVARQATMEDAIQLNRINLVGVYGTPTDRRALVRLSSGRYIKVKVGDRVDGGTVARITDSTLQYQKGNRMVSLEIPQG